MKTDLFDFELPEELIALRPATPRDQARMLVVDPASCGRLADKQVLELPDLLRPGDVLVLNNTRVIPAALEGIRERNENRAHVSFNLIKRVDASRWRAFARPAKRLEVRSPVPDRARHEDVDRWRRHHGPGHRVGIGTRGP